MTNTESARKSSSAQFYIHITASLLIIAALVAVMLAAVNSLTEGKIAQNKLIEVNASIASLFGEGITTEELTPPENSIVTGFYRICAEDGDNDRMVGYCVRVAPSGFGGELDMMVAVTPEGSVGGIRVISHSETPGIGSAALEEDYLAAYNGKSGRLAFGSNADLLAGATFSSRAILEGVNAALACCNGGEA